MSRSVEKNLSVRRVMEIIEILSILEKSGQFRESISYAAAMGYGKNCPLDALKMRTKADIPGPSNTTPGG
jgi:hypothetical protein